MSDVNEQDYRDALSEMVDSVVAFLQIGTELGKSELEMMGTFQAEFVKAAQAA